MAPKNICRLCSTTDQIFDVFHPQLDNGEQLRFSILLATGIQINETDVISKMVCHRCCEIALKLHKYRTNAVENDKLLKEKSSQPYIPPMVDQNELLLTASKICGSTKLIYDALNISIKTEAGEQTNGYLNNLFTTETSSLVENKTDSSNRNPMKQIKNAKEKWKHPSVQTIFNKYPNIILSEQIYKSHIDPVISLDAQEVSDWYSEQLSSIEEKLPNINIKKVPNVFSSPSSECSSQERKIEKPCPKKFKKKRNYMQIIDSDDDVIECVPTEDQEAQKVECSPKRRRKVISEDHRVNQENIDTISNRIQISDKKEESSLTPDTFLCRTCNKMYDTLKELQIHEYTHLRCKFCQKKMKNVQSLDQHQNETCAINIIKNQPTIELSKIDTISSIREKYSQVFEKPKEPENKTPPPINIQSDEFIDYSELENIEKPPQPKELVIEESIANQYFTLLEDFEKNNFNTDVICISDESDNESETPNPPKKSVEQETLKAIIKKHFSPKRQENSSQTLITWNKKNVTVISRDNHIKISNIFGELFGYKVPIHFKSTLNNISAEFKPATNPKIPQVNYNWTGKKIVKFEKDITLRNLLNSKPNVPKTTLPYPNTSYAQNYQYPIENRVNSTQSLLNMFTGVLNTIPQQLGYKQSVPVPNSTPTPSTSYEIPATSTIPVRNAQDDVFYEEPEQVFYNNQNVNVNNYFMLPNNVQRAEEPFYVNNTYYSTVPLYQDHRQQYNFEQGKQNGNTGGNQNTGNVLRIKNVTELS